MNLRLSLQHISSLLARGMIVFVTADVANTEALRQLLGADSCTVLTGADGYEVAKVSGLMKDIIDMSSLDLLTTDSPDELATWTPSCGYTDKWDSIHRRVDAIIDELEGRLSKSAARHILVVANAGLLTALVRELDARLSMDLERAATIRALKDPEHIAFTTMNSDGLIMIRSAPTAVAA